MKLIPAMRFLILLLFFLLLFNNAKAQSTGSESVSAMLITISADTLHGQILVNDQYDHSWRVQFREEGSSTYRLYRPHEVYSYSLNGGLRYFSVEGDFEQNELQIVFMREDIKGDVSLYSTMLTQDKPAFFVRGPDARLIYLQSMFYIEQLRSLFNGCNHFLQGGERINRRYQLNHEGIYNVFAKYYECSDAESDWQVEVSEISRNVRYGIIAGFNTSNLRITSTNNLYKGVAFDYVPGYTFGIYMDVPVWNDKVYFKPEVLFTSRGGEAEVIYPESELSIRDELDASFRYLVFNLPFRYETSLLGLHPYVSGGGMLGLLVGRDTSVGNFTIDAESEDEEVVFTKKEIFRFYNDISLGFNLGVGVKMPLGSTELFAEGRYSRIFSNLNNSVDNFRTTALEILVGFSF